MSGSRVPSRMHRQGPPQPVQGIGSAFAQNQALAGAQDPEAAAKLSELPPEERAEYLQKMERERARREEIIGELLGAYSQGLLEGFSGIVAVSSDDLSEKLNGMPTPQLEKLFTRFNEWLEDKEISGDAGDLFLQPAVTDPADPLYDPMMDHPRRKALNEQLEPMSFSQMVFKGYVDQTVTVREGLTVTFRTLPQQHGLWLERELIRAKDFMAQYGRHWFSSMQVATSVQAINGESIGPDLSPYFKDTEEHRKGFLEALADRLEYLGQRPAILNDILIVHYTWFCGRVRRDLLGGNLTEKVGNS